MSSSGDQTDRALGAFLMQFAADREEGNVRPLSEYLKRFPSHEDEIAREYLTLTDGGLALRAAPASNEEPVQRRFGPYLVESVLGRGGQATVYLAVDERIGRQVALKVLRAPLGSASGTVTERFRREAELLARLEHPAICVVHDADLTGDTPFLAMRYVRGDSLEARIETASAAGVHPARLRDDTDSPMDELLHYFEKCARALHVAHESGFVHRDIKPGNLMVTPDGEPVILDFGLAQDESGAGGPMTLTGELLGTPAYLAPEMLIQGHAATDRRCDVYSLGVSLFECVCLARPFSAPTRDALFHRMLHDEPTDVRRLNPALSRDFGVVVHTAIDKDPNRRYRTALDFAEDLRRLRVREPVRARPAGPLLRAWRFLQRNPIASSAAAIVFVALLTALLFTTNALDIASEERDAREKTLGELNDLLGLADAQVLKDLRAQRRSLCFLPEVEGTEPWLARAQALLAKLPGHRRALAELRERAQPYTDAAREADRARNVAANPEVAERLEALGEGANAELAALEPILGARHTWEFATPGDGWRHETLVKLVEDLEAFGEEVQSVRTKWSAVAAHAQRARTVDRALWRQAARQAAAAPVYGGLALVPQPGLVPVGSDPASGLLEFAHLASGKVPVRDPRSGRLAIDGETAIVFVLLPGGEARIGASQDADSPHHDPNARDDEGPVHVVRLDPFFLAKHEMTKGQYRRLADRSPSYFPIGRRVAGKTTTAAHPVEWVEWEEAMRCLRGHGLTLPTEVQWEYALRAGTRTPYWTGTQPRSLAGFLNVFDRAGRRGAMRDDVPPDEWLDDGYAHHAPVGSYRANPFGLHDMLGNVSEWCRDVYRPYSVPTRPGDGLRGAAEGERHVVRGGSFYHRAAFLRSGKRGKLSQFWGLNLGFRAARALRR